MSKPSQPQTIDASTLEQDEAQQEAPVRKKRVYVEREVVYGIDSSEYYQTQVDRYLRSASRFHTTGNIFFASGGALTVLGLYLFNQPSSCESDPYGYSYCDNENQELGAVSIVYGVLIGCIGIPFKIVGAAKNRKASRFQESLEKYQAQQMMGLMDRMEFEFTPTYDVANKRTGAAIVGHF